MAEATSEKLSRVLKHLREFRHELSGMVLRWENAGYIEEVNAARDIAAKFDEMIDRMSEDGTS